MINAEEGKGEREKEGKGGWKWGREGVKEPRGVGDKDISPPVLL